MAGIMLEWGSAHRNTGGFFVSERPFVSRGENHYLIFLFFWEIIPYSDGAGVKMKSGWNSVCQYCRQEGSEQGVVPQCSILMMNMLYCIMIPESEENFQKSIIRGSFHLS